MGGPIARHLPLAQNFDKVERRAYLERRAYPCMCLSHTLLLPHVQNFDKAYDVLRDENEVLKKRLALGATASTGVPQEAPSLGKKDD